MESSYHILNMIAVFLSPSFDIYYHIKDTLTERRSNTFEFAVILIITDIYSNFFDLPL